MARIVGLVSIGVVLVAAGCNSSGTAGPELALASAAEQSAAAGSSGGELRMVPELPPPSAAQGGVDQPLSPNDVIEVDVFQVDDLDKTVQIDAGGNISLPLIGSVTAGGKSVRELEQELETAYGANYLQSPEVTVFIKESVGQRVTVDGEVAKAGNYPVTSQSTLIEAIAVAGGLRDIADPSKVYVFREYQGGNLVANYDIKAIRNGQRGDPRIYGGDKIVVFTSQGKVAMQNLREALGMASNAARIAVF